MRIMQTNYLWFIFNDSRLALFTDADGKPALPRGPLPPVETAGMRHHIGMHDGMPCIAYSVEHMPESLSSRKQCILVELREAHGIIGEQLYTLAGSGRQLIHWDRQSQYCSVCGVKTVVATAVCKRCPGCGNEVFPPIATAVLVLLRKEDSILLVRAHNFKGPFFGLVAGYLEPGETLEQCVAREVLEETSLSIDNISYFGCQPWPYPSGLMVGFSADYREGDLVLQQSELSEGAFYTRDNLPILPPTLSLTRRMIERWRSEKSAAGI